MNRTISYTIKKEDSNKTVLTFLKEKGYSKQNITDLKYKNSDIQVNGIHVNVYHILKEGDELTVLICETENSEKIPPVKLPFDVIYEDEDLVVVNKPAGMPVHPSLNNYNNTLGNAAAYYYQSQGKYFVFRCINRLDRDTTGLVIIAKNMISSNILGKQHKDGIIKKEYTAIVLGKIESEGISTIDAPIGRAMESTILRQIDHENGDRAVTHYEVIRTGAVPSSGNEYSLIKLHLETGRTHQIRVHMQSVGHPLIGDFLYNPDNKDMNRQALHVGYLSFVQPITGETITLTAPLPEDMNNIINNG